MSGSSSYSKMYLPNAEGKDVLYIEYKAFSETRQELRDSMEKINYLERRVSELLLESNENTIIQSLKETKKELKNETSRSKKTEKENLKLLSIIALIKQDPKFSRLSEDIQIKLLEV